MRYRAVTTLGLVALLALLAGVPPLPVSAQSITVVSWGGSYGRAVHEGANIPFTEATGIRVGVEDYNGGLAQIRAQVDVGNIHWDVVDLEIADAVRGCDEGLLEPVDIDDLPPGPDGTPAADDFAAEAQTECGVGNLYWSTVYAYNDENFAGEKPNTMADFFDLAKFPGRRGMRRVPQVNLEFALIADGVPLDEVYATLRTPEGLDRAFAKLETIRDEVVWWEAGAQPPQMLADGEVVMSTAYNGRIFNAQVMENQPFVIVWDGQLLDVGQIGIVAGTPRLEEALRYVAFKTSAESLARIGRRISYSPARRSGMPLVTTHVVAGVEMAPHLPASPGNVDRALRYDWAFWVDHQDELNERFSAWLAR
ncbi:MAG: ABC transporter substrate-binding protein [Gemmatimonadales bacterium]|nr:ABC transporter substrate-binding protein [Gemmatimonadales bacterium]MYG47854.1 ABC transporter substrate-binding protein [Gemmatimonadales bacterium]MYK01285.1 ABC transporter substrate-binding protein [Candidatus Palauibacter ramosifaciens]